MLPGAKKGAAPKDYVGDELEAMKSGGAKYESVEDLLLAAIQKLADNEHGQRLTGHRREMRGEAMPEEMEAEASAPMDSACDKGECEHPEHQREDSLPEDL